MAITNRHLRKQISKAAEKKAGLIYSSFGGYTTQLRNEKKIQELDITMTLKQALVKARMDKKLKPRK